MSPGKQKSVFGPAQVRYAIKKSKLFLAIFGAAFSLIASITWYVAGKGGVIYFDDGDEQ